LHHHVQPNLIPPRPPRRRALSALHIQPWMPYSSHARRLRLPPRSRSHSNTQRWTWIGLCSCTSSCFASLLEQYCLAELSHAVRNGATRSLWYNRRQQRVSNHLGRSVKRHFTATWHEVPRFCILDGADTLFIRINRHTGLTWQVTLR